MSRYSRRDFIKTGVGLGAATLVASVKGSALNKPAGPAGVERVVASGNGLRATAKAMEIIRGGGDPLDAVIAGVNIVEDDPNDMSVGYGGLPNAEGVVELDSSVMYGPTHAAGAVASIRNIKNPSKVAKLVLEETPHVLLVGEGALRFALAQGFKEENLLTEKAREVWLKWKNSEASKKDWPPPYAGGEPVEIPGVPWTHGTINCVAIDKAGRLAGVTTTSGLAFKLPGRVGDSPIIGAGLYVDNEFGAAGSTGVGEINLQTCASFRIAERMGAGMSPEQACLKVCEEIVHLTSKRDRYRDKDGRPTYDLSFYALNPKGEFGSASIYEGASFAVHDGKENKLRPSAFLYKKAKG